jgi:aminoglycoside phosphotransferase family enzyme/predicted kinase
MHPASLPTPSGNAAGDGLPPFVHALLDPAAYPAPRPSTVELRQTHISYVLLAGERVYKIKKPVALGFLDYSTPTRRAYYCRREVQLNRRFAPEVYLGVVPIVERQGQIRIGGPGEVIERAVVMRRLPEAGMLTHLLAHDRASPDLLGRIAARVAACHAVAASGPGVVRYGRPAAVRQTIEDNLARAAAYVGRTLDAATHAHLVAWTADYFAAQRALLAHRARAGRIRDGHGDLHAASICAVDPISLHASPDTPLRPPAPGGEPAIVLFDCIEFSSRLRCTDVAAEVAFLAMDLDHSGRADLAQAFVRTYVDATGDTELPTLLPLYLSYRATVRGLVASIAADEPSFEPAARVAQAAVARSYFDLARYGYTGGAPRPLLLLVGGLPATGKSALARALAGRLAAVAVNSDVVRKRRAGIAPTTRRAAPYGEGLYAPAATEATYAALAEEARQWLEQGVSVVLDATFRRAAYRAQAVAVAEALRVPWLAIECVCAPAVARARLAARAQEAAAVSDADWAVYEQLAREWEPWTELPAARRYVVDTGGALEGAVAAVLAVVGTLA